jgi:hypothetical protein
MPSSRESLAAQLSSVIHATTALPLVSPSLRLVRAVLLQVTLLATYMTSHVCQAGLFTPDGGVGDSADFVQIDIPASSSLGHLFCFGLFGLSLSFAFGA